MRFHTSLVCVAALFVPATTYAAVDFQTQILPIFELRCVKCHGAEKAMAKLKLNSAAGIEEKLADDKLLVTKGSPEKSELYARLILPADHKKRMPKGGDPLDKASIDLIAAWIKEGAAFTAPATETAPPAEAATNTALETTAPQKPQIEALPLPKVSEASQEAIDKLIAAGGQVLPLYAESSLLDVSFALASQAPTDGTMKLIEAIAPQVYILNLKNAKLSEQGWSSLAKLSNLSQLNLQGSSISDSGGAYLAGLERLESLNLYDTQVGDAILEPLRGLKHLQKLYLWKTKVTYAGSVALEQSNPGIEWNLGWDHPEVARKRLEQQKTEFTELLTKAQTETEQIKIDLKVAEDAQAAAATRLKEVEESLAKLTGEKPAETTYKPKEVAAEAK